MASGNHWSCKDGGRRSRRSIACPSRARWPQLRSSASGRPLPRGLAAWRRGRDFPGRRRPVCECRTAPGRPTRGPARRGRTLAAEVARDDADVVVQLFDGLGQGPHGAHADIGVKVGEMQDGEPLEGVSGRPGKASRLRLTSMRQALTPPLASMPLRRSARGTTLLTIRRGKLRRRPPCVFEASTRDSFPKSPRISTPRRASSHIDKPELGFPMSMALSEIASTAAPIIFTVKPPKRRSSADASARPGRHRSGAPRKEKWLPRAALRMSF